MVLDEPHAVAFLDHRPLFPGHCLLIPREHHETLADLPQEQLEPFFATVQLLARAIPDAMGKPGSFVAMNNVVSQSVPHLHVHIIPRRQGDGFFSPRIIWRRVKYRGADHLAETAAKIRGALAAA